MGQVGNSRGALGIILVTIFLVALMGAAFATTTPVDTTPPVITVPASMTLEAASSAGANLAYFNVTVTDNVDSPFNYSNIICGDTTVSNATPSSWSGDVFSFANHWAFPIGTTTVACNAIDFARNSSSASFTVTVVDTTPPVITVPTVLDTEATSSSGAVVSYAPPTATDLVDGSDVVTCNYNSGDTFALGTTTVTCNATDAAGNAAIPVTFRVNVVDTTPPVTTVGGNYPNWTQFGQTITLTCSDVNGAGCASTHYQLNSGGDNIYTTPIVISTDGLYRIDFYSVDNNSNSETVQTVYVGVDQIPPVVSVPADITAEATSASGAVVTFSADATDDVLRNPIVSCSPVSGAVFLIRTTTVTCHTSDSAGNADYKSFSITVRDTTPPSITAPADVVQDASAYLNSVVLGSPRVLDLADASPQVLNDAPALFPIGETSIIWTATDASGNFATATQKVTITNNPIDINGVNVNYLGSLNAFVSEDNNSVNDTNALVALKDLTIVSNGSSVFIPAGTEIRKSDGSNIDASALIADGNVADSLSGLAIGYAVDGALKWGLPNLELSFDPAIQLSIWVGTALNGTTLDIQRSTSGSGGWTNDGILQATCVVTNGFCDFNAAKASYYAVLTYTAPVPQSSGGRSSIAGRLINTSAPTGTNTVVPPINNPLVNNPPTNNVTLPAENAQSGNGNGSNTGTSNEATGPTGLFGLGADQSSAGLFGLGTGPAGFIPMLIALLAACMVLIAKVRVDSGKKRK